MIRQPFIIEKEKKNRGRRKKEMQISRYRRNKSFTDVPIFPLLRSLDPTVSETENFVFDHFQSYPPIQRSELYHSRLHIR